MSVFRGGSTVPLKFELRNAAGVPVPSAVADWLAAVKGSHITEKVDESLFGAVATTGSTYRYEATARQYIYNWSTKTVAADCYYRVGVRLDDRQTYFVTVALR